MQFIEFLQVINRISFEKKKNFQDWIFHPSSNEIAEDFFLLKSFWLSAENLINLFSIIDTPSDSTDFEKVKLYVEQWTNELPSDVKTDKKRKGKEGNLQRRINVILFCSLWQVKKNDVEKGLLFCVLLSMSLASLRLLTNVFDSPKKWNDKNRKSIISQSQGKTLKTTRNR